MAIGLVCKEFILMYFTLAPPIYQFEHEFQIGYSYKKCVYLFFISLDQ